MEQQNEMTFANAALSHEMMRALGSMQINEATEIQSKAITPLLEGRDVVAKAPTGTGKTFAFGIPLLEQIDPSLSAVQSLILCPTRELAMQITGELLKLARYKKSIRIVSIYGGQQIQKQIFALKKRPQIIVATPGRLLDHLRRRTIKLNNLSYLVLDEADEMLNMGFRADIDTVLSKITNVHQTALFSATMSREIENITKQYLVNPLSVAVSAKKEAKPNIEECYVEVKHDGKIPTLTKILKRENYKLSLVFCNTKHMTDRLAKNLRNAGHAAEALHGDMRQPQRDKVIKKFRNGDLGILVATDVAARGIDVKDIDAVFNYDVPLHAEYYVHRIGRTGRAKKSGKAYTFIYKKEKDKINMIMKKTHHKIRQEKLA